MPYGRPSVDIQGGVDVNAIVKAVLCRRLGIAFTFGSSRNCVYPTASIHHPDKLMDQPCRGDSPRKAAKWEGMFYRRTRSTQSCSGAENQTLAGSRGCGNFNRKVWAELNRRWGDDLSVLPYSHLQTLATFATFC